MPKIHAPKEAYESGLLNEEYHERLFANLGVYVRKAGVPPHVVWSRLSEHCVKGQDYDWAVNLRKTLDGGLVYNLKSQPMAEARMKAIVGLCLRNYTDGRLLTLQEVLRRIKEHGFEDQPTVLLIPNFSLAEEDKFETTALQRQELLGMLIDRATTGKKTVLYVANMTVLEKQYGPTMKEHLETYFAIQTDKALKKPKVSALS
jgi:hypothetical protein